LEQEEPGFLPHLWVHLEQESVMLYGKHPYIGDFAAGLWKNQLPLSELLETKQGKF